MVIKLGSEKIAFAPAIQLDFYNLVKRRVEDYLRRAKLSRYATFKSHLKTIFLLTLAIGCYFAIFLVSDGLSLILLYGLLGYLIGSIGFNFTHDVMHGSYFASSSWNRFWSYLFDLTGTSSYVWKISHNQQHHIYTNIPGHDEDIDKAIILRLSPKDKVYFFHRFQAHYALFLYFFTTLNWVFFSDYKIMISNIKKGKVSRTDAALFFVFKFVNLLLFFILPLLYIQAAKWEIVLGYLVMHLVGGFTIALIFQLAHIVESVTFPIAENGAIPMTWAEHELRTTANFAPKPNFFNQFYGGLNYQIEHHLFPHFCHIHYKNIAPIVKQAAFENELPYHELPSTWQAICSHLRVLKKFGKGEI